MSEITTIDQVSEEKGAVILSLQQFSSSEDREAMVVFQDKLNGYISAVKNEGLYEQFPDLKDKPVRIRLICSHELTPVVKAKLDRVNATLAEVSIGFEVVLIKVEAGGRDMLKERIISWVNCFRGKQ
ncbi:MAG TPA: DUF6572 domain-containing protein [Verrucomicrobiae bacterium]